MDLAALQQSKSTGAMMAASAERPGLTRMPGLFYLGTIVTGVFAEGFARSALVVNDNALVTTENILSRATLYRFALASDLLMLCFYVAVTVLLYEMLLAVSRRISLVAAGFSMTGIAVLAANTILLFIPLLQSGGTSTASTLATGLTLSALALHTEGYGVSLVFFGVYCVLLGYLIVRSGFIPRAIGGLMGIGGLCHLLNSFAEIVAPELAQQLPPQLLLAPLVGEAALSLWLLAFGVDPPRLHIRA